MISGGVISVSVYSVLIRTSNHIANSGYRFLRLRRMENFGRFRRRAAQPAVLDPRSFLQRGATSRRNCGSGNSKIGCGARRRPSLQSGARNSAAAIAAGRRHWPRWSTTRDPCRGSEPYPTRRRCPRRPCSESARPTCAK